MESKVCLQIQDVDQKEGMSGKLKFDLQSESYRSILAIMYFCDVFSPWAETEDRMAAKHAHYGS